MLAVNIGGTLQVCQNCGRHVVFFQNLPDSTDQESVFFGVAVREVDAKHVNSGPQQLQQFLVRARSGPQGCYNFSAFHGEGMNPIRGRAFAKGLATKVRVSPRLKVLGARDLAGTERDAR